MDAIRADNVSKTFRIAAARQGLWGSITGLFSNEGREIRAVDSISFSIRPGEFVGYVGPNGAGKSTTIKMLTGILHPTWGEVRVSGFSPQTQRREVARRIGVVFGQRTQLWWDLPVRDSFELLGAMYDVPAALVSRQLERFDEMLEIGAFIDTPVRKLSLGQRMRADLAAALLHRPPILFLDEPTIGLDVVAKQRMRAFLREINRSEGVTILLTTHDMDDIEQLCSRVIVINEGRIAFDGDTEALRRTVGSETAIEVEYAERPRGALEGPWTLRAQEGNAAVVAFNPFETTAGDVVHALSAYGRLRDIRMIEDSIESVIERIYRRKPQSGPATVPARPSLPPPGG